MNLRKKITIILSAGLLIVLLIGVNAYHTVRRLVSINNWVIHTHLVLQKMQQVQSQLTSLDSDLRGYLLSDNSFFKADYIRNAKRISEDLETLYKLTSDNPSEQQRIKTLMAVLRHKLSSSEPLFRSNRADTGTTRLDSIRAVLDISDQFRLAMNDAQVSEGQLLDHRNATSDQSADFAIVSNGVGALVALLLIGWAIYLLIESLEITNQLNRKLKDSEQRVVKFLEAMPISVVVVDAKGEFYYANQAATELFGSTNAFFGTYASTLRKIGLYRASDGKPYPIEDRPIYQAMRGNATQIDDVEMRMGDRTVQVMTSASPIYNSEGALAYVVSSSVDISDRVQSALQLKQAKELAEEAVKLKENFLANMSHEIRTPLNAMLGFTDLLEGTRLDADQKDFVAAVRTAGKNLLTIVNDILDMSKIEAGMIQFESIPFNVDSLLASIQTMFQATAADKSLYISVRADSQLPPVLLGDPTRLTQILLNLLSNSIKFTKEGGVTVSTRKLTQTSESVRVRFVVEDTGIGMAEEVLPHIFERFRQATDFTTRYYGGTGLGLNIVKSLTEMQGGLVSVESTLGQGSRFSIEIEYLIASEQPESAGSRTDAQPSVDARPLEVLVVEDNQMNQKLAIQVLKRMGHRTFIADNGQKAIDYLQTGPVVDIILMDIQMPVMDGYETTRYIRNKLHSLIPIIAMTAHALASERELCLQTGMNDFIPKPFQIDELRRVLQQYGAASQPPALPDNVVMPLDAPVKTTFSVEYLLESVGNDADFAGEILDLFLKQTAIEIGKIRQAVSEQDLDTIGRILHVQKVPIKMFAMTDVIRIIATIESLRSAGQSMAVIAPFVDEYIDALTKELPAIQAIAETTFNRVADV